MNLDPWALLIVLIGGAALVLTLTGLAFLAWDEFRRPRD